MDPLNDPGASRVATTVPMWFESAPKDYKYPWNKLRLPSTKDAEVSDKFSYLRLSMGIDNCTHIRTEVSLPDTLL